MITVQNLLDAKGSAVYSVSPDAPVYEALEELAAHHIGALLVMDEGRLVGIVSERDYARKVILKGKSSADTPVREIMTDEVLVITPNKDLSEVMQLMTENRIRHLPVVDGGNVVGVISIGDVVKTIIEQQAFTIDQLENYISGKDR